MGEYNRTGEPFFIHTEITLVFHLLVDLSAKFFNYASGNQLAESDSTIIEEIQG
jgi:hypothetical protein